MEDDKILVTNLKKNSTQAFDSIFLKYAKKVYAFILGITKQHYIAEEVTQIVFIKIWEKRSHINEKFLFKSFIFSVTYNETISFLRKENSETKKIKTCFLENDFLDNGTEIKIEFQNLKSISEQIINLLPEKRKKIYKMSKEEGLSNKEIADQLHISIKTVENQMTLALKTLRKELKYKII